MNNSTTDTARTEGKQKKNKTKKKEDQILKTFISQILIA